MPNAMTEQRKQRRLTQPEELAGKTIRACLDSEDGRQLVLVFSDDDWCVVHAIDAGPDASVSIFRDWLYGRGDDIKNFLAPEQLLEAQLLSPAQHEFLLAQRRREDAAFRRQQAERLLREAAALESADHAPAV